MYKNLIFISYYTVNTLYEDLARTHLMPSLEKWNLRYQIYAKPDLKDWSKNTRYKANILLDALRTYTEDIVFIDIDATIEKNPIIFTQIPKEYDIGVHLLDWFLQWRKQRGNPKRELLTGTMFIRNNERTKQLLKAWVKANQNEGGLEQKVLQNLLNKFPDIKIYNLPPEYCCVIMQDNSIPYHYVKEPVILHHQASRKYKRKRYK